MISMWPLGRLAAVSFTAISVFFSCQIFAESFRPLQTQGTQTLQKNQIEVDLAVEYREKLTFPFTAAPSQPDRNELQLPRIGLRLGMSERTELQLDYAYLTIDEDPPGVGKNSGSGDVRFSTKYRFFDQKDWKPDLALHLGAKLPNADDKRKLGTDKSDLFFNLLIGWNSKHIKTAFNIGFAILESPNRNGQDDVLRYGVAAIYKPPSLPGFLSDRLDIAIEANGIVLSNENNDQSSFLGSLRYKFGPVRFYFGSSAGFSPRAEDFGFIGGLTWQYGF